MTFIKPLDSISDTDFLDFKKGVKDLYIRIRIYYFNPVTRRVWKLETVSEFNKNNSSAVFSLDNKFVKKLK